MLLFLFGMAWASDCATPTSLAALDKELETGLAAYADFDVDGFERALDGVQLSLVCVDSAVPAGISARVHLVFALQHFGRGNSEVARGALDAAYVLDDTVVADGLLPSGHPLSGWWNDGAAVQDERRSEPKAIKGRLFFDGVPTTDRPSNRATLVQQIDNGAVMWTKWVAHDQDLPSYKHERVAAVEGKEAGVNAPLLGVSVGLVAVGAGLYAAAVVNKDSLNKWTPGVAETQREAELTELQNRSNALATGAAVAAGLGAVGIVVSVAF